MKFNYIFKNIIFKIFFNFFKSLINSVSVEIISLINVLYLFNIFISISDVLVCIGLL